MTIALHLIQDLILLFLLGVVLSIFALCILGAWSERQEKRELARRRYERDVITAKEIGNRLNESPMSPAYLRRVK